MSGMDILPWGDAGHGMAHSHSGGHGAWLGL